MLCFGEKNNLNDYPISELFAKSFKIITMITKTPVLIVDNDYDDDDYGDDDDSDDKDDDDDDDNDDDDDDDDVFETERAMNSDNNTKNKISPSGLVKITIYAQPYSSVKSFTECRS